MLIVGENEASDNTVAVRKQGEGDLGTKSIEEFAKFIDEQIKLELNSKKAPSEFQEEEV
jgi:threonyl-tRNA synthetase